MKIPTSRLGWRLGVAGAAAVLGGGVFLGIQATAPTAAQSGATTLRLSNAAQTSDASDMAAAMPSAGRGTQMAWRRLRRIPGVRAEVVLKRGNSFVTVDLQRGKITAVSGGSLTVLSADGTSWTWSLAATTVIRKDGRKATAASLAPGDRVLVVGPISAGVRTARVVVVPRPRPAAAATSTGSSGAGVTG